MSRAADAILTGFAKSQALAERSLAPLHLLRQQQTLRRIVCVTWDSPELDGYANWIGAMPDVSLERVAQPSVNGTPNQRGVIYQVENLRAALACIPDDDGLVLKLRPDFVCDAEFMRKKIESFDAWSRVPSRSALGIEMPRHALQSKIWIPWADSNQPFFYEDAAFLGRKCDLHKLLTDLSARDMEVLGDASCGSFAHVVRYSRIFARDYPIFSRFLREYRYFVSDMNYRSKLVKQFIDDGFLWHLIIAHAWILHSQFHVDAGQQGELQFYSNNANKDADWSNLKTLRTANPYDTLDAWRNGTLPTKPTHSVGRTYGRLMDDAWQTALFTRMSLDFPRTTIVRILANVARSSDGRLAGIEDDFYRRLDGFYHTNWLTPDCAEPVAKAG
jgi:hypothetical protein